MVLVAEPADDKKDKGRPTDYRPAYNKQARKLCLLGATDAELADFFEVSEVTINAWKNVHPAFLKSVKAGKARADAHVAQSLYHRAVGYEHDAVKIIAVARGGNQGSDVEQVPYIERYPPDTTAAIFWLKNRRPQDWRDKQEQEHTFPDLTREERQNRVAALLTTARDRAKATNGNGNGSHG